MRRFFLKELESLRNDLLRMSDKSVGCVTDVLNALENQDAGLARKVLEDDDEIDQLEVTIDGEAVRYITLRAPVAGDVRLVTVAMKTSHDLERIGDEASSIAKRTLRIIESSEDLDLGAIRKMGDMALALVRESIQCLLEEDAAKAIAIPPKDKAIDILHKENYAHFTKLISANPSQAHTFVELIFISKSLERVGDHATNIAEEIVYLLEGHDVRHTDEVKRSAT